MEGPGCQDPPLSGIEENDMIYGMSQSKWENLPLDVKGVIAIGWSSNDIGQRYNLLNFFNTLSETNKHCILQGLYANSGYFQLLNHNNM